MKTIKLFTLICAVALLSIACKKEVAPEQTLSATFIVDAPLTKVLNDGQKATELSVRVFDAEHNFLYEKRASRSGEGWKIELELIPATYSFTFWACSDKSDAFTFENEYMTLSYSLMDMNSDDEDAFWASLPDIEMTSSFTRAVTLKRPFAYLQLASDIFINEPLEGVTSAFTITGAMPTRMNLITGETDQDMRKAVYTAAPVSFYTIGHHPVVATAYVLIHGESFTAPQVDYRINLADGRFIEGTVEEVPLERNFKTTLKDY